MRVLDQNGSIRQMLPSQVTNKIEQRKDAIATDRNGSEIRYGDIVREVGGESKSGVILHIHRAFVYVHNRTQPENAGIFVARCVSVMTIAAKGGRATAADAKTNSALKNGDGANAPMAPPRSMGRDRLIGKTVTVRKGPYKGVLGIVRNTTETTARIEMHSKAKVISVNRDEITVKEYVLHSILSYLPRLTHLTAPSPAKPSTCPALADPDPLALLVPATAAPPQPQGYQATGPAAEPPWAPVTAVERQHGEPRPAPPHGHPMPEAAATVAEPLPGRLPPAPKPPTVAQAT